MTDQPRLTKIAQQAWVKYLTPGAWAIDATAGNGHDAAFIARAVSPGGHLFALDIQKRALQATARRLESEGLLSSVTLVQADHSHMRDFLPCTAKGRIRLVCFNLGYLPGGEHSLMTRPDSTLCALRQALSLLAPNGALSVIAYRGHPGGAEEARAVESFVASLPESWTADFVEAPGSDARLGPVWWLVSSGKA